ncbi:hypothetical protein [Halorussus lipolyticus]|uniref:hypothetical protein n=1 Tax=Halorussus lipolyticus TaxID=3034024 RepID=UPI0023E859A1|nr:hypothetical protein [Halorussus sp. DT80]
MFGVADETGTAVSKALARFAVKGWRRSAPRLVSGGTASEANADAKEGECFTERSGQ